MNQAAGHLTDAQIRDYVEDSTTVPEPQKPLEAHLADCESCLHRLLDAERIHLGLLEGDGMKRTPYPGCPAEETLQELAAGICPPDSAESATEHAAHCNYCGPLLGKYMREFSEELETEDAAILKQLESSKPKWQKKFVERMFPPAPRPWFGFWPRMATAVAGVAGAAWLALPLILPNDLSQAQRLVASAYGERRTTEMRLTSAPHASFQPVPVVKGSADGNDLESVPTPLVEAEAMLKKNNKSGELNPQWLQIQGRIDLLQGTARSVEQAIEAFEKALAKDPNNMGLKVDLATAYFEKEMRADRDRPVLVKTIELLTDVVKNSKPDDNQLRATALFDLAITYEKSGMIPNLAAPTWKQYLQEDPTSDWAKEARKHLEVLEKAMPPPKQQGYAKPSYFLAHSSDGGVLEALEEYQDIALRSWLATAVEDRSSEAARAVSKLAELLRQRHSDPWLQDFLSHSTPADLAATKMLSTAFTYDLNDLHHQAIRESQKAADIFARHNNLPGELRARYQEVYGLQRSLVGDDCLERVSELWARVFKTGYHWLQAQLALEKATCANLTLDFDTAAATVDMSRNIARQFRFPELALRVAGFDAGIQKQQENYDEAWKKAVGGLGIYWRGKCTGNDGSPLRVNTGGCAYSWERVYQFYSVMQQCARKMALPHASEALLLTGISIIENNAPDDVSLRGMLYLRLANILSRQGETKLAESEANKAESLLQESPSQESTAHIYAALTRIELAEFELNGGNGELALSKIDPLRTLLANQDDFVKLDFYTVEGDIYTQLKRFDEAVAAYRSGIQVAESSLNREQDGARLNWISATGKTYRGLTRTLLDMGKTTEALSVWEWFLGRSLENENSGATNTGASATSNKFAYPPLPPALEPHLVYASFEDGLQVWIVRGAIINGKWIPVRREELRKKVIEFAKECANPSQPLNQARTLYALLLQPIAEELPANGTIALELDETLWGLTFEALQNRDGRYFGEDRSVVYSPGLLAETVLRRPRPLTGREPMLLIDASEAIEAAPLPGHSEEVSAVKRTFANTRTLGPSVITAHEVSEALSQSSEFHFSGHGKQDGTGTALVIGSHLSLEARDFTPVRLKRLQLAVLSACSSGSAKKGSFDQSNLVRSFLSGGVPTVIASRWDVDSRSASRFMQTFYGQLRRNEPASQALQYAQAEMRSEKSHPYYWAAFTLTGRAN